MDFTNKQVEELVQIAQEVEISDPIDWADLSVSEEESYRLMAMHVVEMNYDDKTIKAIITKLLVENMVLNLRLMGKK